MFKIGTVSEGDLGQISTLTIDCGAMESFTLIYIVGTFFAIYRHFGYSGTIRNFKIPSNEVIRTTFQL
jgi:hypothetical protein